MVPPWSVGECRSSRRVGIDMLWLVILEIHATATGENIAPFLVTATVTPSKLRQIGSISEFAEALHSTTLGCRLVVACWFRNTVVHAHHTLVLSHSKACGMSNLTLWYFMAHVFVFVCVVLICTHVLVCLACLTFQLLHTCQASDPCMTINTLCWCGLGKHLSLRLLDYICIYNYIYSECTYINYI